MQERLTDEQLIKIGSKILYYRRIRKMTQLELATAVGISESYLSKIERGKNVSVSSLSIFLSIVKELNVKLKISLKISNSILGKYTMEKVIDKRIIGLNIMYYRKLKGYTRKQLAQEANISLIYMAKIEAGLISKSVSLTVLSKIADILDVSIDKLIKKL